jgi:hypothetical protein
MKEQPDLPGELEDPEDLAEGLIFVIPYASEDEMGYGVFWAKMIRASSQEDAMEYFMSSLEGGDSWIWGAARDDWGSSPERADEGMWYMTTYDPESEDQDNPESLVYALTPRPEMVKGFDTEEEAKAYALEINANIHGESAVDTHEMMESVSRLLNLVMEQPEGPTEEPVQLSVPGTEPRYLVNRHWEMTTPESIEAGDAEERGTDYTDEEMDLNELESEANSHGPWEPSSSQPHPGMWWQEIEGSHDRAYFEKGEEVRHSLHVSRLDGSQLDGEDLLMVNDIIMGKRRAEDEMEAMGHDPYGYD